MKYFLTQEEYDQLSGQAESIRSDYQKQLNDLTYQFTKDVNAEIERYTGGSRDPFKANPGVDILIAAWQVALTKMKIQPPAKTPPKPC